MNFSSPPEGELHDEDLDLLDDLDELLLTKSCSPCACLSLRFVLFSSSMNFPAPGALRPCKGRLLHLPSVLDLLAALMTELSSVEQWASLSVRSYSSLLSLLSGDPSRV